MSEYYILDGREVKLCDPLTWATWFEKADRHIGDDEVNDARVSTVFLGLDHSFGDGPPLLFETMVFGGPHSGWQDRYSTYAQAEAGHKRVVEAIRAGHDPQAE